MINDDPIFGEMDLLWDLCGDIIDGCIAIGRGIKFLLAKARAILCYDLMNLFS